MDSGRVRRWYEVPKAGTREIPTIIRHTIHKCWLNGQNDQEEFTHLHQLSISPLPSIALLQHNKTIIVAKLPTKLPHPWLENMYESMVPRLRMFEWSEVIGADMGRQY